MRISQEEALRRPDQIIPKSRPARRNGSALVVLLQDEAAQGTDQLIELARDDTQWVMPAKNHASTRFSGLDQIKGKNVRDLQVAWTFSTGLNAGHEAAPLVTSP